MSNASAPIPQSPPAEERYRLRSLLRAHTPALALALLAACGEALANLLQPWPLKVVLDDVIGTHPAHGHFDNLLRHFAGANRHALLDAAIIAVGAIALLDAVCSYSEKYLISNMGQRIAHDLRRSLYAHLQRLSLAYYDRKRTGDLTSRVTDDTDAVQSFLSTDLLTAAVNLLTLVGMIGVMFALNWRFTLISISIVPFLFAIVFFYTRRVKKASRAMRAKQGEIASVLQEVLSSIRVVKAFARESYEIRRLEAESLESVEIAMTARGLKARLNPVIQIVVAVGTGLVLWFGATLVLAGGLDTGGLVVFVLYLGKMYKPMQQLSQMSDDYAKAAVGYERIQEVFDTRSDVVDLPRARPAPRFRGGITFEHVSFHYTPAQPVLTDVCLAIEPGQLIALVGPTGAGKTTIVSLIARFYDPVTGVVRIDGGDVRQYRQASLRGQIAFVLQETLLFHGPLWQNIAYGKPEASRAEIERAAELANATEFIRELPQGLDTVVGERGVTLSGGQRQRIAIARAMIRSNPLLILDEPTASLDAATEHLVFAALDRLLEGKTAIVIAHRLATIQRADQILVVDHGGIAERGTHAQLLAGGGMYAELHRLQQASPAASA